MPSLDIATLAIVSMMINLLLTIVCVYLRRNEKRVRYALRDSEERFRGLAENAADVIWQIDSDLRYCYVNEADAVQRGFRRDEVIGRLITDFLTPEGGEQVVSVNRERLQLEQQGLQTGSRCFEVQQLKKDGSYCWTEVHAVPLRDGQGAISGYIGITRDISVRKSNEQQQAELLAREQRAREEQEWFLTMISHEYRTPLAILMSNIEILRMKQSMLPGQLETNLSKMQRAVNRLLEVFEQGRRKDGPEYKMQEIILEPVVASVFLVDLRNEAVSHWGGARLLFTVDIDEDIVLSADSQLLRTALLNLLDNGIKYSSPGAVVEFESRHACQDLEFSVKNRSRRALQVQPEIIFRKYIRGPNSADLAGTGVGLWLTRQIVELHGGSVDFAVENFHDVTVTVRLPIDRENEVDHAV